MLMLPQTHRRTRTGDMLLCVLAAQDGITAALLLSALLKENASLRSPEVYCQSGYLYSERVKE